MTGPQDAAVERAAAVIAAGARCMACQNTGFMEDGPAGATYSAPCTFCRDGIPNWARDKARSVLAAVAPVTPVADVTDNPLTPDEANAVWHFITYDLRMSADDPERFWQLIEAARDKLRPKGDT